MQKKNVKAVNMTSMKMISQKHKYYFEKIMKEFNLNFFIPEVTSLNIEKGNIYH